MSRYLRLYAHFLRFSLSRAMMFRMDFWFRIAMDCVYYVVSLLFFRVLYNHTETIGGWTEPQTMIFVSAYLAVDALQMTFFMNSLWHFPALVNKGDLDYHLLRPVSTLFMVTLRDFAANSFINVVVSAGIMIWAIAAYPTPLAPERILIFVLLTFNGTLIFFMLQMLLTLPVFWTHSARGFQTLHWIMVKLAERPDGIYSGVFRTVLMTALPYTLIASIPARILFEENTLIYIPHILAVTAVLFFAMLFVWRRGLKAYASASS